MTRTTQILDRLMLAVHRITPLFPPTILLSVMLPLRVSIHITHVECRLTPHMSTALSDDSSRCGSTMFNDFVFLLFARAVEHVRRRGCRLRLAPSHRSRHGAQEAPSSSMVDGVPTKLS